MPPAFEKMFGRFTNRTQSTFEGHLSAGSSASSLRNAGALEILGSFNSISPATRKE